MSIKEEEVDEETFLYKINQPEGFCILISDYTAGRYELHVYRPRDMKIYVSPKIHYMSEKEAVPFSRAVEKAVSFQRTLTYKW